MLEDQEKQVEEQKSKTISIVIPYLFVCVLLGISIFIVMTMINRFENTNMEMAKETVENEKKELENNFIPGENISFTITEKSIGEEMKAPLVTAKIFDVYVRNNETNQVYEMESSLDFYYKKATNEVLEGTISKDNKSVKIGEEVFPLEELNLSED